MSEEEAEKEAEEEDEGAAPPLPGESRQTAAAQSNVIDLTIDESDDETPAPVSTKGQKNKIIRLFFSIPSQVELIARSLSSDTR